MEKSNRVDSYNRIVYSTKKEQITALDNVVNLRNITLSERKSACKDLVVMPSVMGRPGETWRRR